MMDNITGPNERRYVSPTEGHAIREALDDVNKGKTISFVDLLDENAALKKRVGELEEWGAKSLKVLKKIEYHVSSSAYKDLGHICEHKKKVMSIGDMIKSLPTPPTTQKKASE